MAEFHDIDVQITAEMAGRRLDAALARLLPGQSRSRIKAWIQDGTVRLGGKPCRPSQVVSGGERIQLSIPATPAGTEVAPEAIALAIVYEDRDCLVIDKPAGLVVHPGAGNPAHTLQNALLGHDATLAAVPRAGLVHRLDKDTSGLMVVARTAAAHAALAKQLLARSVSREYEAVCVGVMTGGGSIDQPIGRHQRDRVRMTVRADGRPAVTHYRVLQRFRAHTHVRVKLETGRTHQIRLHLSHLGYPIVGDPVYGGRLILPRGADEALRACLRGFHRQALHAVQLSFDHPRTGKRLVFDSGLPEDFRQLLAALGADSAAAAEQAPPRVRASRRR